MITLGCKVNQYESQAILAMMEQNGFTATDAIEQSDVIILNSCTVTGTSDQKMRQTLRRARRQAPNAVLVLTGCMPQAFPDAAKQLLSDADIVVGNSVRHRIPPLVMQFLHTHEPIAEITAYASDTPFEPLYVTDFHDRTRAFVKIEDGCNRFCSYCIIPYARGRVRSKRPEELHEELARIAAAGYQEVVLVGINLSAYGQEFGLQLCDAVEDAAALDGIRRVRLGSLEPDRITDELLQRLAAVPKFCPQFHLSLQSGCTATLKRMNRHYTAPEYAAIVHRVRDYFPDAAITTDLMVGFAGETEEEFAASLRFAEEIAFAKIHVFPYSRRPGTVADRLPDQVAPAVKEARTHRMLALANRLHAEFLHSQIGRTVEVLFETACGEGEYTGFTANYAPVRMKSDTPLHNQLRMVRITAADETGCIGVPADNADESQGSDARR